MGQGGVKGTNYVSKLSPIARNISGKRETSKRDKLKRAIVCHNNTLPQ
jgi:hypothetical protein